MPIYDLDEAVSRARMAALHAREPRLVVEVDLEDHRELLVKRESYVSDPEFEAFDGRVLAEVSSDGDVEYLSRGGRNGW